MSAKPEPLGPQFPATGPSLRKPTARSAAYEILQEVERHRLFADEVLDHCLSRSDLDARDRALAVELVYGVLRHRGTLDWRLAHVSDRPLERLPLFVRTALRLGAYQLLCLDRIPASAAVNESVSLVKRPEGRDWSGYLNAALRTLIRKPAPEWPDARIDPVTAFSVRYSCPRWLVERWVQRFGHSDAEALCRATLEIPPLTIRTNTLRMTRQALQHEFSQAGYETIPTAVSPAGLIVEKRGPVTNLPLFEEGAFYVEDEAAQLVPLIVDPQPGERILDASAAPGGKATHLAALMRNEGEIIALDRSPQRLRVLEENCRRLGIRIVTAITADATQEVPTILDGAFDRALLDVPCSGLGVLRRHPEAKWQKHEGLPARHQATQRRMIEQVCRALRPGGVLVYSTCSTEPEENEQVIEQVCRDHPEFSREPVVRWLPPSGRSLVNAHGDLSTMFSSHSMDAFFAARLRKAAC